MAKGPSAGQSTMIILFDRFLGISHYNKQAGEAGPFQDEMCDYMPEQHRQLLRDFCVKLVRRITGFFIAKSVDLLGKLRAPVGFPATTGANRDIGKVRHCSRLCRGKRAVACRAASTGDGQSGF